MTDFIQEYFSYVGETECPMIYHRWAAMTALGAYLGRDYNFLLGHFNLKPNLYIMLMGEAGARKSTAIKIAKKMLQAAGYTTLAATKTSKEAFLLDLAGEKSQYEEELEETDILEANLFGEPDYIPQLLIAADEFNNFVGNGNIEFLSMLGELWDFEGDFESRVKNSKSPKIADPYISILSGNTATGFSLAFPSEAIGQGIFSRLILIRGEATGKKIPFPVAPSVEVIGTIVQKLQEIKTKVQGTAEIDPTAKKLLADIYTHQGQATDVRFISYMNRRFSHLLKVCLVISASKGKPVITEEVVLEANTVLTYAEQLMPKALGEFGKARYSEQAHKVIRILEESDDIVGLSDLWKQLVNDLDDIGHLRDIVGSLVQADKIIQAQTGFIIKRAKVTDGHSEYVDFSLLTEEERGGILS